MKKNSNALMGGASEIDITPTGKVQLSGAVGHQRFAEKMLDPIKARVLVISDRVKKICFISLDLTIVGKETTTEIRKRLSEFGFERDAVMVHATQTHTAPSAGHFMLDDSIQIPLEYEWLRGSELFYAAFVTDKVIDCVRKAESKLQPVEILHGRGIEGRISFNRRGVTVDGGIYMPPRRCPPLPGPVNLSHIEGPVDPEVGILAFRNPSGKIIAALLHFTCHPVCVFPQKYISADWPGAWCREMQKVISGDFVPIVANGCCGNINPRNPFAPDFKDDHEKMGHMLTEVTSSILNNNKFEKTDEMKLEWQSQVLDMPYRRIEPDLLEKAETLLRKEPDIQWTDESRTLVNINWFRAVNLIGLSREIEREKGLKYQVQIFRIGDCALIGLPGEPFVEGQLQIKLNSPAQQTLIAHCANDYIGYIPHAKAFDYPLGHRGHEVNTCSWSKLYPGALDDIAENTVSMLKKLFNRT